MTANPLTPEKLEEAARAVQRVYLDAGHPSDFSMQELEADFQKHRDMYERITQVVLIAIRTG